MIVAEGLSWARDTGGLAHEPELQERLDAVLAEPAVTIKGFVIESDEGGASSAASSSYSLAVRSRYS
jgi:hypothetical protein